MTTSVGNNSVFRSFFEKQKLTGPNFIDWYRQQNVGTCQLKTRILPVEHPILVCTSVHNLDSKNPPEHGHGKTVNELHAMLKLHEESLPKKDANPALHAIRAGRVQKNQKNKPHKAGRGGKELPPPHREGITQANDGHLSTNEVKLGTGEGTSPVYLTELMKKKKLSQGASTSGIFTIELYSFPSKSWIYDTGCGTHICITTQGLRGSRKLKPGALSPVRLADGHRHRLTAIGTYHLRAPSGLLLLEQLSYAPSSLKTLLLLWQLSSVHSTRNGIEKLQQDGTSQFNDIASLEKCVSCLSGKMLENLITSVEMAEDAHGLDTNNTDLGKTIKSLRSDRGGEYMSQEFLDHLKEHRIIAHRTPPYMPQNNGVSERRNRTLLDMVRSMMSQTTLPKSFWDYALETAARILNMVPTKKVDKTPYEIWHGQAPKLSYLRNSETKEEDVKEDESNHNKERYTFEDDDADGEFDDLD
ncbi:zinc finger, CCHC-type containing protein [Tanacetum coccineum]